MPNPPSMFDAPPPPSTARVPDSNYLQPNFGHGLRIWWAFFWPTTLISGILTVAINYALRRLYEDSNIPATVLGPIMKYDAYVLSYIVALFVMDYILQKKFRHFRIALLSNHGGEGAQILDSTLARALRVWWTYSWRTIIYRIVIAFVTAIPTGVFLGLFERIPLLHAFMVMLIGIAVDAAAGLFVIYSNILDEDFADFRVGLLPLPAESVAPVSPAATPAQT
jgi:hypothetical protein